MKNRIIIENHQEKEPFLQETCNLITHAINMALKYMDVGFKSEVSVTLTYDEEIRKLNKEHRNIDKSTDVLSFPQYEQYQLRGFGESDAIVLGDIVLSLEHARAQSIEYGHSYTREVAFLCVHSVLHLLGYDHMEPDDESRMNLLQESIMKFIGIGR